MNASVSAERREWPAKRGNRDLESLHKQLSESKDRLADVRSIQSRLVQYARRTLAASPAAATTQYHKVLLCLAEELELSDAVVTPHRAQSVNDRLLAIPFSIKVTTTLDRLLRFANYFEQLDALHRIKLLEIEPTTRTDNPMLLCRLQVETACVDVPGLSDHVNPTLLFVSPFREDLASRSGNPFATRQPSTLLATTPQSPTETVGVASELKLVGVIDDGDNSEAWLFDKTTGRNHIVRLNDMIHHESFMGRLVGVDDDTATLQVAADRIQLSIGQHTPVTRVASALQPTGHGL